jgi:hypothetical protein
MNVTIHFPRRPEHVAEAWYNQYGRHFERGLFPEQKETYQMLLALGPTPTAAQVEEVIGNKGWTTQDCSCCGYSAPKLVSLESEYSDKYCYLCLSAAAEIAK